MDLQRQYVEKSVYQQELYQQFKWDSFKSHKPFINSIVENITA